MFKKTLKSICTQSESCEKCKRMKELESEEKTGKMYFWHREELAKCREKGREILLLSYYEPSEDNNLTAVWGKGQHKWNNFEQYDVTLGDFIVAGSHRWESMFGIEPVGGAAVELKEIVEVRGSLVKYKRMGNSSWLGEESVHNIVVIKQDGRVVIGKNVRMEIPRSALVEKEQL